MPDIPEIRVAADSRQWAQDGARLVLEATTRAIETNGRCLMALSGGSTPKTLYERLATPEWSDAVRWSQIELFFGDERCVPPDHPDSNYHTALITLVRPLGLRADRIHRMEGELPDATVAARRYEDRIRSVAGSSAPAVPRLDLILLGLGDDGHTASLFPDTLALSDNDRLVTVGQAAQGVKTRLTLTLDMINRASMIVFLVMGAGKTQIIGRLLQPKTEADRKLPAALVRPHQGHVVWLLDRPAAAALTTMSN